MPDSPPAIVTPRPDLGIRRLVPVWREAMRRESRRGDVTAGLVSTGLSVALALVLAHQAGIPATATLATAAGAGFVAALLGGWSYGVSGPGVVAGVVIAQIAQQHGLVGLAAATAGVGLIQLTLGALGLGRLARLVPLIVVHGFTLGMGALLAVFCLPYILGVEAPGDVSAPHIIDHAGALAHSTRPMALVVAGLSFAITLVGIHWLKRVPMALLAIAFSALAVRFGHLAIPTLPDLPLRPVHVLAFRLPSQQIAGFVTSALALFVVISMETSLSASAEEQRTTGERYDPDQELIAHGLANMFLPFLGAAPAAGSVVRSRALRTLGAHTRAASMVHALSLAALIPLVLLADRWIPLAALAGVVVAHGVQLLDPRPVRSVWRVSKPHALVVAITAVTFVLTSLLTGIETGLFLALVLAVARVARFHVAFHRGRDGSAHQVTFDGPMTFLALPSIDRLRQGLARADLATGVIFDVRNVLAMDYSGCHEFVSLVEMVTDRGGSAVVLGAAPGVRAMILAEDRRKLVEPRLAVTERDIDRILGRKGSFQMRALVAANLERFRGETREHYESLFEQLADGQHPHTLFITCVDSRISPSMLTGSHPGEVFIVRCLGAMVPPPVEGAAPNEGAAIEYAVGVLGVRNIVVCGHSKCGAVKAATSGQVPDELSTLQKWLAKASLASGDVSGKSDVDDAARAITVKQIENVKQYKLVRDQLEKGQLELHAWFYDVGQTELFEWNEHTQTFEVFGGSRTSLRSPSE